MRVIKGNAATAHHVAATELEQMRCPWDPMQMIKDRRRRGDVGETFVFLSLGRHFVLPVHIEPIHLLMGWKRKVGENSQWRPWFMLFLGAGWWALTPVGMTRKLTCSEIQANQHDKKKEKITDLSFPPRRRLIIPKEQIWSSTWLSDEVIWLVEVFSSELTLIMSQFGKFRPQYQRNFLRQTRNVFYGSICFEKHMRCVEILETACS